MSSHVTTIENDWSTYKQKSMNFEQTYETLNSEISNLKNYTKTMASDVLDLKIEKNNLNKVCILCVNLNYEEGCSRCDTISRYLKIQRYHAIPAILFLSENCSKMAFVNTNGKQYRSDNKIKNILQENCIYHFWTSLYSIWYKCKDLFVL